MPTPTHLRVRIEERNGPGIDIRLPYILARTGLRFGAQLAKRGLDLPDLRSLSETELEAALREGLTVADGHDTVRIYCE